MKTETRQYTIRQSEMSDFNKTPSYYNLPLLIEYRGKKQILGAGTSDRISVFRYYIANMAVLSTNFNLNYASLQIINLNLLEKSNIVYGMAEEDTVFFDNVDMLELKKDFFDYSENAQADILAQYLY